MLAMFCAIVLLLSSAVAERCHCAPTSDCSLEITVCESDLDCGSNSACESSNVSISQAMENEPNCCVSCGIDDSVLMGSEVIPSGEPQVVTSVLPVLSDFSFLTTILNKQGYSRPPPAPLSVKWQVLSCIWLV